MTDDEIQTARARVRAWDVDDRRTLTRMTGPEVDLIATAVALLDARPCDPVSPGPNVIEVP